MFFNFKKTEHYDLKVFIWLYIVCINLVLFLLEEPLAALGFKSWPFWLVNICFFLIEEKDLKKKLVHITFGAIFGCILACLTILSFVSIFAPMGHVGLFVPVAITLALVILVGPFCPAFFNSVTFLYFVVSTIIAKEAVSRVVTNSVCAVVGTVVVNLGCVLIISLYTKSKIKKAKAAAAAAAAAKE